MIVVDANVVIYYCMRGPYHAAAEALRQEDSNWHCPDLWRSEVLNVLAGEIRRANLELGDAIDFAADAEACVTETHTISAHRVLELVARPRSTAYDLQYVALARQLEVKLVTADKELLRAFPEVARPLV